MSDDGELTLGDKLLLKRHGSFPQQAAPKTFRTQKRTIAAPAKEEASDSDDAGKSAGDSADDGDAAAGSKRRRNKHAPAEMSSANPVGRFRRVVDVPRVDRRGEGRVRGERRNDGRVLSGREC
jgi:hypothetical protein